MIKASLLYPSAEGARFDFTYWTESHLPWLQQILSPALQGVAAEKGLPTGPDSHPLYIASGHLLFESVEALQEAYFPHMAAIQEDIKNFTDVTPVMVLDEVLIG